ncbi:hypothetical protein [Agriterribacter sp.]|uniref:TlpA family protein disulfide reductase n=1 Tax=Agriterribacter sp. TaxID=2821509 RepID=UPI002B5166CE|nr:hypothetical protein [Agriterribacter sp.]HTN05692.1 hypothetical protein [Agriterribacter sp.]
MKFSIYQVYLCVLVVTLWMLSISRASSQGLQVDDPIINLEVKRIVNYPVESARLTDFVGKKALLIDFWFAACTSCIESFPKLDSIQKEFKDDLNILLVTFETKEKTLRTFNTIDKIKHVKLPSVVADTLLHLIFPHASAPHEIWVDRQGKIKAITDHTSINRNNIRSLIAGEELNLPVKKDNMEYSVFDLLIKSLDLDKMLKYNVISSHQPGLPASDGMYLHPDNGFLRAQATNVNFQSLYIMAYDQWGKGFNYNRLIIDGSVLVRLKETEDKRNTFCYDSWWRDTSRAKACSEMQNELDHFFNLTSYLENRKVPCLVLRKTGTQRRFISNQSTERQGIFYVSDTLCFENVYLKYPVENVLNYGRYAWAPSQFIDETGYEGKVNIQLPRSFESIAQVNRFLKNFDLEVTIEDRWLDVIIIKDNAKL